VRALYAKNKVHFARAEQLLLSVCLSGHINQFPWDS